MFYGIGCGIFDKSLSISFIFYVYVYKIANIFAFFEFSYFISCKTMYNERVHKK